MFNIITLVKITQYHLNTWEFIVHFIQLYMFYFF